MPVEDYPTLPEMPPAAGRIGSDAFATAVEPGRPSRPAATTPCPALTGVRIEIEGDTLTLVATDRYRLAVRELRWNPAQPDLERVGAGPRPGARRHGPGADLRGGGLDRAGLGEAAPPVRA